MRVAVYGTLRAGFGNHALLGDAPLVGVGRTEREFIMLTGGFPVCLVPENAQLRPTKVTVEVYDISASSAPDAILRRLDNLEGHPDWYRREEVHITLDSGEPCTAQMYIMPGNHEDFPRWQMVPHGDWAAHRRALS